MLKGKKLRIILIIILAISLTVYFFYRETGKKNSQVTETKVEPEEFVEVEEAPVKIEQGIVSGMKNGQKEWEIEAEKIYLGKNRTNTIFEEIKKATIFKENTPYLDIKAEKSIADMKTKSMEWIGNVTITSEEGDILKGEHFFWDSGEEKISSRDPVEIQVKDGLIFAENFSSDKELSNLQLEGNAKVVLKINQAQ